MAEFPVDPMLSKMLIASEKSVHLQHAPLCNLSLPSLPLGTSVVKRY